MKVYHKATTRGYTREVLDEKLPEKVEIALREVIGAAKEGLLALSVAVGLEVLHSMMEAEVAEIVGPKGKHLRERQAFRHGTEKGSVVLGGRKVSIRRPRVRSTSGREIRLQTYEAFQDESFFSKVCFERMLYGLSCRRYSAGLEPVGSEVEACATSRSSISRRFAIHASKALEELLTRQLRGERYSVLMLDGVVIADHTVVVALGITAEGEKRILGIWEGATENATVCRSLLEDLVARGLEVTPGILVVIDGSKALRAAVRDVLGQAAVVQRCQVHKKRNVLEHLPEKERDAVSRKLNQAWRETNYDKALKALQTLADELEDRYPGAAASLREGLEETLTVTRLRLPEQLIKTLKSTNAIESAFDKVRLAARNVKRWRNGRQVLRWSAAGLMAAEKGFSRIKGYRLLPLLTAALEREVAPKLSSTVKTA